MVSLFLRLSAFVALLVGSSSASPSAIVQRSVRPVVKGSANYGLLNHQGLSRDSCVSTAWKGNVLWTCRDTEVYEPNGTVQALPIFANTASFSLVPSATTPAVLDLASPQGFSVFYPFAADECSGSGSCADHTRWVGWPDTAPVVTTNGSGWAFVDRLHLDVLTDLNNASYSLYSVGQAVVNGTAAPVATLHTEYFWSDTEVGYGEAASVVRNGYAYLYGPTLSGNLAVARCTLRGNRTLADKSRYEYYVNGAWVQDSTPLRTDSGVGLANLPGPSLVQGSVYWSKKWKSYVYISGDGSLGPNFNITTAPNPEGPWSAPVTFYSGSNFGTGICYSQVAHPGLTDGTGDYIFLSWTTTNSSDYLQPLVRIDWA